MKTETFDLIIIGGGATGAGIALDASLRGLSVALFEQNDFAEGTSSRSTKLVHGGVRYLEAAVKKLDRAQYALVKEGLRERKLFLHNASHLAHPIELITPLYKWYEIPYVYAGLFLYDLIAGKASLGRSKLLSPSRAKTANPTINPHGLKAAVSYYDGAFNDSRMTIALLQSAAACGAQVFNHHEVTALHKEQGQINGLTVRNRLKKTEQHYSAKMVVNATGPFVDNIRKLDNPDCEPMMQVSSGIHIVVDAHFLPTPTGLMIPETSDGRVLFVLPYQGKCLVGTSDQPAKTEEHPTPTREEIAYLLENVNRYFDIKITQEDILSSFCGLRPLLRQESTTDTSQLVREHIEKLSDSGLLSIAGGKWTSYRSMAQSAVDIVTQKLGVSSRCQTADYKVTGSKTHKAAVMEMLEKENVPAEKATYLYHHYGDQSLKVVEIGRAHKEDTLLHPSVQTTTSELIYCIRHEFVRKPLDFLVRRINLGLVDTSLAMETLPQICDIMARELAWSSTETLHYKKEARALC